MVRPGRQPVLTRTAELRPRAAFHGSVPALRGAERAGARHQTVGRRALDQAPRLGTARRRVSRHRHRGGRGRGRSRRPAPPGRGRRSGALRRDPVVLHLRAPQVSDCGRSRADEGAQGRRPVVHPNAPVVPLHGYRSARATSARVCSESARSRIWSAGGSPRLAPSRRLRARAPPIAETRQLRSVDRNAAVVPARISGWIEGASAAVSQDLAIAVNGTVAAVTSTYGADRRSSMSSSPSPRWGRAATRSRC